MNTTIIESRTSQIEPVEVDSGNEVNDNGNNHNNRNDSDEDLVHPRPSFDTMLKRIEGSNLKPIGNRWSSL